MRAAASALLTFAGLAAANLPGYPDDQNITIKVAAGSSIAGHRLVAFADGETRFPEFVPADKVGDEPETWFLFYKDYGHFGWFSLNIDIADAKYGIDILPEADTFEGPVVFIDAAEYGTNIWGATTDNPALTWTGSSADSPYACSNNGHLQLGIYTEALAPKNCEKIALEWTAA